MRPGPSRILAVVAELHGVAVNDIIGPSKKQKHVDARYCAIRLIRQTHPEWSVCRIATELSRNHTTVGYALGRYYRDKATRTYRHDPAPRPLGSFGGARA